VIARGEPGEGLGSGEVIVLAPGSRGVLSQEQGR
jgi:hypothetical protein